MINIQQLIAEKIAEGLKRSALSKVSDWVSKYRVMPQGPWSFERTPWTLEMCDSTEELVIGQKAAQMGFTEVALNKTFFVIDIKHLSALYVLPATSPDASDFSTSRFDPALELSPHLSTLFTDVQNIGHKRAGSADLFIRGSRSRSQMKSLPVALMIFDEVDEMVQENIHLAFERLSGQVERQAFMLSTPTIENVGINKWFLDSSQDHYFFKCTCCGKFTELIFPECLVITSDDVRDPKLKDTYIICKECGGTLKHENKRELLMPPNAQWVSQYKNRMSRGFHVNQLYSTVLPPWKIAESYLHSQDSPSAEQEFYNSKLGLTHTVKGSRITEDVFLKCIRPFKQQTESVKYTTMGIDVGKKLHFEINEWEIGEDLSSNDINLFVKCKILRIGEVINFEDLEYYMQTFNIRMAVIDQQPETRKSLEFCRKFDGRAKMCYYGQGINSKNIKVHEEEHRVTVDRTSWLDLSLSRFHRETIIVPVDYPIDYKNHIMSLARVYREDKDGNQVGFYVNSGPDHWGHARNYSEIAFKLSTMMITGRDI